MKNETNLDGLDFKPIKHGRQRIVARATLKVTSTGIELSFVFWTEWAQQFGYDNGVSIVLEHVDTGTHIAVRVTKGKDGDKPQMRYHGRHASTVYGRVVQVADIGAKVQKLEQRAAEVLMYDGLPVFLFEKRAKGEELPPRPEKVSPARSPKRTGGLTAQVEDPSDIKTESDKRTYNDEKTDDRPKQATSLEDAKINREIYRAMKESQNKGMTMGKLADRFGLSHTEINNRYLSMRKMMER